MPVIGAKAKTSKLLITVRAFTEPPVTAEILKKLSDEVKLVTSGLMNEEIISVASDITDDLNTLMFIDFKATWYSVEVLQNDGMSYQLTSVRADDEDNL